MSVSPPFAAFEVAQPIEPWDGVDRRTRARHVWFLNSAFDNIGFYTALERIVMRDPAEPFAFVVTPNVDHLVRLRRDGILAPLYAQAWLTVCDSKVLELMAAMSGEDVDVTPGSDLTAALFEHAIQPDEPVTVIGGDADVIEGVKARYGLTDVRWHEPPMGLRNKPEAIAECAQFVADNPSRFVFLCGLAPAGNDRGSLPGTRRLHRRRPVRRRLAGFPVGQGRACAAVDAGCAAGMVAPPHRGAAAHVEALSGGRAEGRLPMVGVAQSPRETEEVRARAGEGSFPDLTPAAWRRGAHTPKLTP